MARYQVAAINYIASGAQRTLLNIDTQLVYHNVRNIYILDSENTSLSNIVTEEGDVHYLPTEYIAKEHPLDRRRPLPPYKLSSDPLSEEQLSTTIVLNEQQRYGYDDKRYEYDAKMYGKRILLYLSSNTAEYEEKAQALANKIYEQNRTFEIEKRQDTVNNLSDVQNDTTVFPTYDIRDVSIKSCTLKSEPNTNLKETGEFVDLYVPRLSSYPIGFCQCAGDAYVMTDIVNESPVMLYSSLNAQRSSYDTPPDFYSMTLSSDQFGIYLYRNKDDLGLSSYSQIDDSDIFIPARRMTGIGHNYIVQVNQRQYESEYDDGDIYAEQITPAKNAYNALYSMQMPSVSSITECREYCGIGEFNDNLYLKYYDRADFDAVSSVSDKANMMDELVMKNRGAVVYPFQKVEMYLPNSFKLAATHKSNLFSVKIKNKGIESLIKDESTGGDIQTRERLFGVLKKDIKNACKRIAELAAPANTQFFDVFFEK